MRTRDYWHTQWILQGKRVRRRWAVRRSENYTRFVILGAPRTGTTLLHTFLNSHPQIYSMGERPRERVQAGNSCSLQEDIFRQMPTQIKAVGCKLFYGYRQHAQYQHLIRELVSDPSIYVIHLTRKDLLRAYISEQKALRTGAWNDRKRLVAASRPKMRVEEDSFREYRAEIVNAQKWAAEQLAQHQVFTLTYEELVDNPDQPLSRLQNALGVRPRSLFSLLARQNPEPLSALITNAEEARTWFPEPA